jgi:hypothetical protein
VVQKVLSCRDEERNAIDSVRQNWTFVRAAHGLSERLLAETESAQAAGRCPT